jgi:hypothetical protein
MLYLPWIHMLEISSINKTFFVIKTYLLLTSLFDYFYTSSSVIFRQGLYKNKRHPDLDVSYFLKILGNTY